MATSRHPLSWRYIPQFLEAVTKTIGIVLVADLAASGELTARDATRTFLARADEVIE